MIRRNGFTLIELMITVAIVAILAAIAYPSYTQHVQKGRRENAKAELLSYVQNLERYYAIHYKYTNDLATLSLPSQIPANGDAHYNVSLTADDTSYTLTATPDPTGVQSGDKCGTLSIDHTGQKLPATDGCW